MAYKSQPETKPDLDLSELELNEFYTILSRTHEEHLAVHGVFLPRLKRGSYYTKDAIVLSALRKYMGQPVSKEKLTMIVRKWDPNTNDVQQARHLARQKGWYIISGTRGDVRDNETVGIICGPGEYVLVCAEKPYPGYGTRRSPLAGGLDELKGAYESHCATCGSLEDEPNLLNPSRVTKLQIAHMNPQLDLTPENAIPQCQECNQAYRDWFIFDRRGRVRDINMDSSHWQKRYKKL